MTGEEYDDVPAQPALLPAVARARVRDSRATAARKRAATAKAVEPADVDPVARVLVDVPLANLDRPFDYTVPAAMSGSAVTGARVKVRFAGQDVDGFVVERTAASDHTGRLTPLRRVVSAEPVLAPEIAVLSDQVAERYAGTRADILRLAVPPRHATTEKKPPPPRPEPPEADPAWSERWAGHEHGATYVDRLVAGESPRAVWAAAAGAAWPDLLAAAAAATYASGRGALLCVPDHTDVDRLDAALTALLGPGHHVRLTAGSGPAARYRDFLAVVRGSARIVVGTRAAAFAPVHDLGLVALWDDGDDLYVEPRAPYPHTREVLLLRAETHGCAALVGGFARTVEAEYLLHTGWAREIRPYRDSLRTAIQVAIAGASDHELERDPFARSTRLPKVAHDTLRAALEHGPVLVQTPRAGYAASLACERCRTPATCTACRGPLRLTGTATPPACRWCGRVEPHWACGVCGHRGLRAPVRGDARTAEELGRTFPTVPVRTSSGDRVLTTVPAEPAIVVATPGAEPVAEGGFAAVVLLDTWLMLSRADLRTAEESLRRWLNAAALVRRADEGGRVVAVGETSDPVLQALVRWDPSGFAQREMDERRSAHLPPASRLASLTGDPAAIEEALVTLTELGLPEPAEVLGPVPVEPRAGRPQTADEPTVRAVIRVPRAHGAELSRALRLMQSGRAARKQTTVRVQVDPVELT